MTTVGTKNEATRDTWVRQQLRALPEGLSILDAGSGEQPYRDDCAHLDYVAQDFGKYDPHQQETGLQMPSWDYGKPEIVCDITDIPRPDGSFQAILCTEVLEHVPDPLAAIREFSRLLPLGGHLILTAPFCSLTHFAPYHFSTGFSRFFYDNHLKSNGFEIVELTPNGNYFEYVAQELRRLPSIAERYSGIRISRWRGRLIGSLLRFLQQCSDRDKGSSELLSFGLHVRAVKK